MKCIRNVSLFWLGRVIVSAALMCGASSATGSEVEQIRIVSTNDIHLYMKPIYHR